MNRMGTKLKHEVVAMYVPTGHPKGAILVLCRCGKITTREDIESHIIMGNMD